MRTRRSPRNQEILWRELGNVKKKNEKPTKRKKPAKVPKPKEEHWTAQYQFKKDPISQAITVLVQQHSALEKGCFDQGPDTCPTWGAIYGLRKLLPQPPSPNPDGSIPVVMENYNAVEIGTNHDLTGREETYQAASLKEAAGNLLYTRQIKDGNARLGSTGQVVFCSDGTSWVIRREA